MAYRRRQGITRASTFKEEIYLRPEDDSDNNDTKRSNMLKPSYTFHSSSSLAAQAIKASAAHRESSLSSADGGDSSPQRSKVHKIAKLLFFYFCLLSCLFTNWRLIIRKWLNILFGSYFPISRFMSLHTVLVWILHFM